MGCGVSKFETTILKEEPQQDDHKNEVIKPIIRMVSNLSFKHFIREYDDTKSASSTAGDRDHQKESAYSSSRQHNTNNDLRFVCASEDEFKFVGTKDHTNSIIVEALPGRESPSFRHYCLVNAHTSIDHDDYHHEEKDVGITNVPKGKSNIPSSGRPKKNGCKSPSKRTCLAC